MGHFGGCRVGRADDGDERGDRSYKESRWTPPVWATPCSKPMRDLHGPQYWMPETRKASRAARSNRTRKRSPGDLSHARFAGKLDTQNPIFAAAEQFDDPPGRKSESGGAAANPQPGGGAALPGARQTGRTTLARQLAQRRGGARENG